MDDEEIFYISDDDDDTLHGSELDTSSETESRFQGFREIPEIMGMPFSMLRQTETDPPEGAVLQRTFNEDLPAVHSYLGENLEEVSGRSIYTESRYVSIPLLSGSYGPLLPGQTFPLTVQDIGRAEMLRRCMQGDHTFGCIANRQTQGDFIYGTTAEIYEYADELGTVRIKAKGRQRFKLISSKAGPDVRFYKMAEVYILPEVKLQHPFNALNFTSLNGLRTTQRERCRKIESEVLVWPKWVYDMYDPKKLVERVNKLPFLTQGLRKEKGQNVMPKDPTELSFWIARHLDAQKRLLMLKLNSPIPRLRWLISFLSKNQVFVCNRCGVTVSKASDMFAMSIEGAQSTYVNAEGYHHDTITLLRAENIVRISSPSTHFSWFPGYAWSIAVCRQCQKHLGWRFIASEAKLLPASFWGLTRAALDTRLATDEETDPDFKPVM